MALYAKSFIGSLLGIAVSFSCGLTPAKAESIKVTAKEKVNWYSASRQLQIIDDRPMVRDFRSLPQQEQTIELPNQPMAAAVGGQGAGSMNAGSCDTIPRGGLHITTKNLAYRTPQGSDSSQNTNAKVSSDNARATNAPALNPTHSFPRPRGSLLRHNQSM
jgi:hypothetical protein